jgi:hypothetical protein
VKFPRRSGWIVALALLVVFGATLAWMGRRPGEVQERLNRLRAAGLPTSSAELNTWYSAVPDSENAATLFLAAASGLRSVSVPGLELDFTRRPSRTNGVSEQLLAANRAYLATNAAALRAIHAALQHPRNRYPINLNAGVLTTLPHLASVKGYAQQLGVCAEMAAECGQPELASQCLLDALKLSGTMQHEPTVISFLVTIACEAITTSSAERVFHHAQFTSERLAEIQTAFSTAANELSYAPAMLGELCMNLDAFRLPAGRQFQTFVMAGGGNSGIGLESFVLWLYSASGLQNRDLAVMVNYYDRSREIASLSPTKRRLETEKLNKELEGRFKSQFIPLAKMMLPSILHVEGKATRQYAIFRCAEVACAVERWRLAHGGALPESLEALVPAFLSSVPEDPMDGRPLKFKARPKGFVVYSIGEDGTDDGGAPRKSGSNQSWDYTFVVDR